MKNLLLLLTSILIITFPYKNASAGVAAGLWTEEENKSLVGCEVFLPSRDGAKRGFLLKQSDSHPGLVVLLPGTPRKKGQPSEAKFKKVQIDYKGKKIVSFTRTGIFKEDKFKNRPLFRTNDRENRKLKKLPYHVVLREEGGKVCRKISNPKVRND